MGIFSFTTAYRAAWDTVPRSRIRSKSFFGKYVRHWNAIVNTRASTCLKHYRSRWHHWRLNRHAAVELLDWCCEGRLAEPLSTDEQWRMLHSLSSILEQQKIILNKYSEKITACHDSKQTATIYIHSDMRSVQNTHVPKNAIRLCATEARTAPPRVYSTICGYFISNKPQQATKTSFHPLYLKLEFIPPSARNLSRG